EQGGTVVVRYHGQPVRGLYFTGPTPAHPKRQPMAWTQCQDQDGHFIFPCLDQPGVKHPWRVTVRVDASDSALWTVVGNGRLAARDGATWVWDQPEPIPAYLLTVVVGRLRVVDDGEVDGKPVRYLVPELDTAGEPADEAQVRRIFGRTPAMVAWLGERLGVAYPWPRYDQVIVHDFIFGGMENVAATTLTDVMLTDDRAAMDNDHDNLVVHELMHQWFGDLVTCQDWSQGWLNEGWATFSEQIWKVHAMGADEGDLHAWSALGNYLQEAGSRYSRAIVSYRYREPIDVFDRHLYEKGSLVLRTLRAELGDTAFWAGTRAYLLANAHRPVHTRDFQRSMEETSGRNLDRFFRQWVWGAGHPTLKVKLSHSDGLLSIQVDQQQTAGPVAEDTEQIIADAFAFGLPVTVVHGDQRVCHRLPVTRRSAGFTLPCAKPPDRVEIDPRLTVLADISVDAPRAWLASSLVADGGIVGRIRAARGLARDGSPVAIRTLCEALEGDAFWGLKVELAALLGKHGGPEARSALLAALGDPLPRVRRAAVDAVAGLRHPDVVAALVAIGRDGDDSYLVEGAALAALGGVVAQADIHDPALDPSQGSAWADDGVQPDAIVALLRDALGRDSWTDVLCQRALEGLSRTRRASVLDALVEHTGARFSERVQAAAVAGLGRLAEAVSETRRPAVDRLVELARAGSWRVRYFALSALGVARDPRAMGVLNEIHDTALEGRLRRTAWESSQRLSQTSTDPVGNLRAELEKLREEGRQLRTRLDVLEGQAGRAG
ncbi:MAG: hypothetical protein GXP62_03875, partial [Oligoflexia bacterium]|nr:hypothetical protein [Oligoflexia bacterium]